MEIAIVGGIGLIALSAYTIALLLLINLLRKE